MNKNRNRIAQGATTLLLIGTLTGAIGLTPSRVLAQIGTTGPAPIRTPKHGEEKIAALAQSRADKVGKELGLNATQVDQMANLNFVTLREMQTLFNTRPKEKDNARLQLLRVLDARQKAVDKVLTPEQREKYNQIAMRDIAAVQSEIIAVKLNLSPSQIKQLNPINEQAITKVKAAMGQTDKARQVEGVRQARAWKDRQYQRVLTSAQYQTMKQMRQYLTPTNADTRIAKEDVTKNYTTGEINPYGPYASAYPINFGAQNMGNMYGWNYGYGGGGWGGWGASNVYPTFWVW